MQVSAFVAQLKESLPGSFIGQLMAVQTDVQSHASKPPSLCTNGCADRRTELTPLQGGSWQALTEPHTLNTQRSQCLVFHFLLHEPQDLVGTPGSYSALRFPTPTSGLGCVGFLSLQTSQSSSWVACGYPSVYAASDCFK